MNTVEISTPQSKHQVLEEKLTSLGLYVTAREAYDMWKADPERIKVLDVRTFEEYVLIGHAEMAVNVPLAFPTYNWDANKGNYSVVINKDFIAHVKEHFKSDDTILVMCRSGGCSAMAGRTPLHGLTGLIPSWSGFHLRWNWKHSVAPWSYDNGHCAV